MFTRVFSITFVLILALTALQPTGRVAASRAASPVTGVESLLSMTCPSSTVCYAGGDNGTILSTKNAGATWQTQHSGIYGPVLSLSCAATDVCYAQTHQWCDELGAHVPLLHTTNGGSTWTTSPIPGCGSAIACPRVTTCYTVLSMSGPGGPGFMQTTDSGKSWHEQAKLDPNRIMESLACPAPAVCYAAFQDFLARTTDSGKRWTLIHTAPAPCPAPSACASVHVIACPGKTTCYAGGSTADRSGKIVAAATTTTNGFRSRKLHAIKGLHGISALSCPTTAVCFGLGGISVAQTGGQVTGGDAGRVAVTTNGGASWRVKHMTSAFPFNTLACATARVCFAGGFLGRLIGTRDGGASWHDLLPALFVSGTYDAKQPLHTYSSWFTAKGPWRLSAGELPGPIGAKGRPLSAAACRAVTPIQVYVFNNHGEKVAGPIRAGIQEEGQEGDNASAAIHNISATGKLRIDVVAHCSAFSVRADGVDQTNG